MQRQLIVNGAILALALGTLGLVWATLDAPGTDQIEARSAKLLASFTREAVSRVVLTRGQDRLELVRAGDDFRIVSPWQERADIASVASLLGALEQAAPVRPADVPREQAGLTRPRLSIALQSKQGRQTLLLGGPAPAPAGAHYAEVNAEGSAPRLYTVNARLLTDLDQPFSKFRETRYVEYAASDLRLIQLSHAGVTLQITQDLAGERWFELYARKELAAREAVDAVLTALARLSTEQFLDPASARAALSTDVVQVRLEPHDPALPPVELKLGGACPGAPSLIVVLREGQGGPGKAGCLAREIGQALRVVPDELRLKTPCFARMDEVEELSLRIGTAKLELARKDTGFRLRAPNTGEVALDAGNQRITEIVRAVATRVESPELSRLGLAPASGELTVQAAGVKDRARQVERVLVGAPLADGSLFLQRERDKVVLRLDAEAARAFRVDASLLRPLEVLSFSPSELGSLSIHTQGRTERVSRSREGLYQLESPAGFSHDASLVADVVQTLGTLRAERWVADTDDGSFGLSKPQARVTLELLALAQGPAGRRELTLGGPSLGGVFAKLDSDPGVFILARSAGMALTGSLVDRSLSPANLAALTQLELASGSRRLRLQRRDASWQSDGPLSPARVLALVEALSSLKAAFLVHFGAALPNEGLTEPSLQVTFTGDKGEVRRLRIGRRDTLQGTSVFYARLDGVDATFAVAQGSLSGLQDF